MEVHKSIIYFNVLKVKPRDLLQKTQYGSLRHLTLGHEELKVGLGVSQKNQLKIKATHRLLASVSPFKHHSSYSPKTDLLD